MPEIGAAPDLAKCPNLKTGKELGRLITDLFYEFPKIHQDRLLSLNETKVKYSYDKLVLINNTLVALGDNYKRFNNALCY
jgi:hypothetical protein